MELISREELLKQIETDSKGHEGQYGDEWLFIDTINSIPTIEERKEGKWINDIRYSGWTCTNCSYHYGNLMKKTVSNAKKRKTVNVRSMHQVVVKERKTQIITKIEFEKLKLTQMKGE